MHSIDGSGSKWKTGKSVRECPNTMIYAATPRLVNVTRDRVAFWPYTSRVTSTRRGVAAYIMCSEMSEHTFPISSSSSHDTSVAPASRDHCFVVVPYCNVSSGQTNLHTPNGRRRYCDIWKNISDQKTSSSHQAPVSGTSYPSLSVRDGCIYPSPVYSVYESVGRPHVSLVDQTTSSIHTVRPVCIF